MLQVSTYNIFLNYSTVIRMQTFISPLFSNSILNTFLNIKFVLYNVRKYRIYYPKNWLTKIISFLKYD